jgi:hypothetical protein
MCRLRVIWFSFVVSLMAQDFRRVRCGSEQLQVIHDHPSPTRPRTYQHRSADPAAFAAVDYADDGSAGGNFVSSYCRTMCQWGRGGNLCRCNAAYFAGKRASSMVSSGSSSSTPSAAAVLRSTSGRTSDRRGQTATPTIAAVASRRSGGIRLTTAAFSVPLPTSPSRPGWTTAKRTEAGSWSSRPRAAAAGDGAVKLQNRWIEANQRTLKNPKSATVDGARPTAVSSPGATGRWTIPKGNMFQRLSTAAVVRGRPQTTDSLPPRKATEAPHQPSAALTQATVAEANKNGSKRWTSNRNPLTNSPWRQRFN